MNEIVLAGCAPTPLASYLKALGVLRLLSGMCPGARGEWRGSRFVVRSECDRESLEAFFLRDYQPTPIMAPWNGGSGFYKKDNKAALEAILASTSPRLALYRECLRLAEQALRGFDRNTSPKDSAKTILLTRLRGLLPDAALDWFDASVLLSGDSPQYPPLLGTGGNDGRLDFTNNFMQRLGEVLSFSDDGPTWESILWLKTALYGEAAPGLSRGKAIGQFSPGQVGGPNATVGFEADSAVNPWDFVLMIEGALSFAAAAVRRSANDPAGVLSYPFTVRAIGAGSGSLGEGDATSARGELWMPIWRQAATYSEIRALLAEGRVALGRKPARDALDFVRAVHRLGGYRGIGAFQRYGLLMRSGNAFLATPLARVEVAGNVEADWLDELDRQDWLTRFRRFAQGDNVAKRFHALRRQLEDALIDLAGHPPTPADAQALVILLGEIEAALTVSRKAQESVPPIPHLSQRWVRVADDGTSAFSIARALSGLNGNKDTPLPLLAQLFPVHPIHNVWMTPEYRGKHTAKDMACRVRIHADTKGSFVDTLISLLSGRLRLAQQLGMEDKPLLSPAGITADHLLAFLRSDHMDHRIAALLPGLSLCSIPHDTEGTAGEGIVPAAFALLKLCLTPDATLRHLHLLGEKDSLPVPICLLAQLATGNIGNRAVRLAWRRLFASGLSPVFARDALPELGEIEPRRAAAALLIPLRLGATRAMSRSVLEPWTTEMAVENTARLSSKGEPR